jgi:hypothetical protein
MHLRLELSRLGQSPFPFVVAFAASCAAPSDDPVPEEPSVGVSESAIKSGINVSPSDTYWRYVTGVFTPSGSCSGTIIGPHHILTAAHCGPVAMNTRVVFYRGENPDWSTLTNVDNVYMRAGVSASTTTDLAGDFADFAVLQINKDIATISPDYQPARLPRWPLASGTGAIQVGRGNHDGAGNPSQILRFRTNAYWTDYSDGSFATASDGTDPGDSGGPLFTSDAGGWLAVHGALWGSVWDWFAFRNRYTSTAYHLSSILEAMGNQLISNWNYYGSDIGMMANIDVMQCATACTQNASCNAWTLDPQPAGAATGNCWLKSDTGSGGFAQSGLTSGLKSWRTITRTSWDYTGSDLLFENVLTQSQCETDCWRRADCKAWTYTSTSFPGSCWLKSGVGSGGNPLSGFTSGYKTTTRSCSLSGGVCVL